MHLPDGRRLYTASDEIRTIGKTRPTLLTSAVALLLLNKNGLIRLLLNSCKVEICYLTQRSTGNKVKGLIGPNRSWILKIGLVLVSTSPRFLENFQPEIDRAFKDSLDPNHFVFEINVGKRRIRDTTTLKLNLRSSQNQLKMTSFKFKVVLCRIRLFPTLIPKIK